ncbi:hypothetical protein BX265_6179 [Streptomyces sp. TLI_235]|nr:DUF4175 domain-containing protein [Streptomyces sp. TLI_235]PBC71569.1 hypothetical protein BX265_6179 [Streptomyces sp. TLI_235]
MTRTQLTALTPLLTVVAGLFLIAFGVWSIYPPAGYIVGGLSCLAVEMWRTDRPRR